MGIDLTGVCLDPLRPPSVPKRLEAGKGTALVSSQSLELWARPLLLGGSEQLDVSVTASRAELSFVRDDDRKLWLLPHHFSSGEARVSMAGRDLEHVFLNGARQAAAQHGVIIEEGRLQLEQSGALELRIEAELVARKLFVKSRILLRGRVGFDEQLNLHFNDLSCTGKGMVAAVACKLLAPHLEAWERRSLPLLSLAFPSVRLRHAQLKTDALGRMEAKAELGEEPEV